MNRALVMIVGAVCLVTVPQAVAAQESADIEVVIDPETVQVEVGHEVELLILVTNNGDSASPALALHIDITSPTRSGSVDPEDWTSRLTRRVGVLDAGDTKSFAWTIKPISSGNFTVYAVALPESGGSEVWPSNGVSVDVAGRRTLNPEGLLPVAIAAPVLVGALLLTRVRRSGRPG